MESNFIQDALNKQLEIAKKIEDEKERLDTMSDINLLLADYQGSDKIVTSFDIKEQLKDRPLPSPIPTGHPKLDSIIGGFYPGQHIIFSAPPKSGKSSFILDLISRMKSSEPLLIPLEQNAEELVTIMNERLIDIPYFVVPKTNERATIEWLSHRITEARLKYNTKVVFIDHFGYVDPPDKSKAEHLQIIDKMQSLRSIAKQLNITIVSVAHVRKTDPTEPPTVEDLYGGAGYLQEADTIVMMWREAYKDGRETKWTNKVLVSVQANRRKGDTGSFRMKYVDYQFIQDDNIYFEYETVKSKSSKEVEDLWNNF